MTYDSNWDKVPLLMRFNGGAGSTALINEVTGISATAAGNTALSQTQFKFGNASCYFDGSGDWVEMPYSPLYDPGSTDFTLELWTYCTQYNPSPGTSSNLCGTYSNGSVEGGTDNAGWEFGLTSITGYPIFGWGGGGSWATIVSTTTALPLNVWCHLALCKVGDQYTIYLNGTSIGTASYSTPVTFTKTKLKLGGAMGSDGNHYYFYYGYLDELRITKGLARYTGNFTPPTEKFPYPLPDSSWDKDTLLLRFNGANNSTVFMDEVNRKKLTAYGDVKISTDQSKFGGSSAYFDGTGDYLQVPSSSVFTFDSGDFTIEFWVYSPLLKNMNVFDFRPLSTNGAYPYIGLNSDGSMVYYVNTANRIVSSSGSVSANTWAHVAVIRRNLITTLYIDGSSRGTWADSTTYATNNDYGLRIGYNSFDVSSEAFQGYLDSIRITKGVARSTGDFTPPISAFTVDANTSLLMHFDGADNSTTFTDETGKTVTRYGDTKISIAQSKIGNASGYFDGTGDYLSIPHSSDLALGSSDFTIECWWYPLNNSTGNISGMSKVSTSSETGWALGVYNGIWRFSTYGTVIFYTGAVNLNAWTHLAIVRLSGVITLFINGVRTATNSNTFNFTDTANLLIGTIQDANNFQGYLDELRITKGLARYTANFTPPDKEFYYPYSPYWEAISLLMHFEGANNSTTFINEAGSLITVYGNSKISTSQFKFGSSCGAFDGTGDYLSTIPVSIGTLPGDFTIECWVYVNSTSPGYVPIIETRSGVNNTNWVVGFINVSGTLRPDMFFYNGRLTGTTTSLQALTWTHVAYVRSGSTVSVFVNGVKDATTYTYSGTITPAGSTLYIAAILDNIQVNGYLDELCITNGYARYLTDFVPPTVPYYLPAPSNLSEVNQSLFNHLISTTQKNILSDDNNYYKELVPYYDDSGIWTVAGIVTIKAVPVQATVYLFTKDDKRLIASTLSNSQGEYTFSGLKNQSYFVWAEDPTAEYNPITRLALNEVI